MLRRVHDGVQSRDDTEALKQQFKTAAAQFRGDFLFVFFNADENAKCVHPCAHRCPPSPG